MLARVSLFIRGWSEAAAMDNTSTVMRKCVWHLKYEPGSDHNVAPLRIRKMSHCLPMTLTGWPVIWKSKKHEETCFCNPANNFSSWFAQSVCLLRGSMFSSKCLPRMCQVGPRQAASLPAESVFFSTEIKINSHGVHGNVLVSVMDILPPPLHSRWPSYLTFSSSVV